MLYITSQQWTVKVRHAYKREHQRMTHVAFKYNWTVIDGAI